MTRKRIILLMVLFLYIAGGTAWANFTEPTMISSPDQVTYQYNFSPDIVEGIDGRLHAFWASNSYQEPEPTYVLYAYSDDGGNIWSPLVQVDERIDFWRLFEGPKCVIDEQGVLHLSFHYINWLVRISNSKYARSADNGLTWSSVFSPIWGGYNRNGNIKLDSAGTVFIAWDRWTTGGAFPNEVYLRNSIDGGITWPDFWSIISPAMLISNRRAEAQSYLIDESGLMHLLLNVPGGSDNSSANTYLISSDSGYNWQERTNLPVGFLIGGIYQYGNELLIPGSYNGNTAFVRSLDNGLTWEGPFAIAGPGHVNQIVSDGNNNYHAFFGDAYYFSNDRGASWSEPDYMGSGTISKLLLTRRGDLLAIGTFGAQIGLIKHEPSDEVIAPEYLSLWEKGSFIYSFDVRGNGEVQVSFPADNIEIEVNPMVTLGDQQVSASRSFTDNRVVVSFPVASLEWTSAALPITERTMVPESGGLRRASPVVQADTWSYRASSILLVGKGQAQQDVCAQP